MPTRNNYSIEGKTFYSEASQETLSSRIPPAILATINKNDKSPKFFELQMHSGPAQGGERFYGGKIIESMVAQINRKAGERPINSYVGHADMGFFSQSMPFQDPFASYFAAKVIEHPTDTSGKSLRAVGYIYPEYRETMLPKLELGALGDFSLAGYGEGNIIDGVEHVIELELESIDMIRSGHSGLKDTKLVSISEQEKTTLKLSEVLKMLNEEKISLEQLQESAPAFYKMVTESISKPESDNPEATRLLLADNQAKGEAIREAKEQKAALEAEIKPLYETLGVKSDTPVKDVVKSATEFISASITTFKENKDKLLEGIKHEGIRAEVTDYLKDIPPCSLKELETKISTKANELREMLVKKFNLQISESDVFGSTEIKNDKNKSTSGIYSEFGGKK